MSCCREDEGKDQEHLCHNEALFILLCFQRLMSVRMEPLVNLRNVLAVC